MAIDSPAQIAVIGAGPIGLEAALYGRFLGYEVDVFERGGVADNMARWGHVRMFTPFRMNRSSLGLAALAAQDPSWRAPPADAILTGREFISAYVRPLAESDLLSDRIHLQTEVLAIGKDGPLKGELIGEEEREDADFRLLVRERDGRERIVAADAVIDATGTYGQHNYLGHGGIPAIGELAAEAQIEYGLPDVSGSARDRYAGRHTLVIGDGDSAATTVVALAGLAKSVDDTRVTWITRHATGESDDGPVKVAWPGPAQAEREEALRKANRLAKKSGKTVTHWPATSVDRLAWSEKHDQFEVRLIGEHAGEIEVDRIVANVGYRPDWRLSRELHLRLLTASESSFSIKPSKTVGVTVGAARLITMEPHFYVLGAKSFGRKSRALLSDGLRQIRDLFTVIGDRMDLDLYATIGKEPLP